MRLSLIQELPKIIEEGKKEVERVLERLSGTQRITLQTNEMVLPSKDESGLFNGAIPVIKDKTITLDPTPEQLSLIGIQAKQAKLSITHQAEWINRLIYGDNLLVLQALLAGDEDSGLISLRGKIKLIYIDPPFDSKADYRTKITLPGTDLSQKPTVIEQFAYADTWKDGTTSYLKMLYPRLALMKELLNQQGSIMIHIGSEVSAYVRILLDEVFGKENFRNEIILPGRATKNLQQQFETINKLQVRHDTLLWYSKSVEARFSPFWIDKHNTGNPEGHWHHFWSTADRITMRYELFGITPTSGQWVWKEERAKKAVSNYDRFVVESGGRTLAEYWRDTGSCLEFIRRSPDDGKPQYWREPTEIRLGDTVWSGVPIYSASTGYPTEKNMKFIAEVLRLATKEDDIVLDCFGGSGTTAAVAEKLKRKWIISDIGKPSCMVMRKRFIDQNANPFLFHAIGDYQKEILGSTRLYKRVGDLSQIVLKLYGAIPCKEDEIAARNIGYLKESRTIVYVDSPNKLTGMTTVKKAEELRNSFLGGGWKKVVVLGWNFAYDISESIRNKTDIEVLVIPPDLLDKLSSKKSYEQMVKTGGIRFSSLQYLTVYPIVKEEGNTQSEEKITVALENYVLLSPDNIPLDQNDKEKLQRLLERDPLAIIEYWSIDPDYDGEVFRSRWQDYRENTGNDTDPYHCVTKAVLTVSKKNNRKVCIKAVDVFGFESMVIETV
ncbi:MAG: site-specific DNA-methyltransferase [Sphingobacteriales bacterium]|nr:MAG: site-specific DNA-methyltransferase [Sphingobacteriales bacterium]